jgi:hypothetical protein
MGLRIRDVTGKTAELQDQFRFVEITAQSGEIAMLVYRDDGGAVQTITAEDAVRAARYEQMYGVKFCPIIKRGGR